MLLSMPVKSGVKCKILNNCFSDKAITGAYRQGTSSAINKQHIADTQMSKYRPKTTISNDG